MTHAIGLIGAGGIGETHAGILHDHGAADLVAVCDLDVERARALADATGAEPYADYREAIAEHDLDAVYVTTPPGTHAGIVEDAAAAGIAVFCEKPIAVTVEDGRAIEAAVEEHGVAFMTGFCLRFCEPCRRLRERLEGIGDPVTLFSHRAGWGVPGEGNWRVDPELACGITIESASHNLDLLRWLGGEVASASGRTANVTHPGLDGFDDNLVATLGFESGAIGVVQNSWTSRIEYLRHGVIGTEGAVAVEGEGWWRLDRLVHATGDGTVRTVDFDDDTATAMGYRRETEVFLDCLGTGRDPPAGASDGRRVLELSHEILGG